MSSELHTFYSKYLEEKFKNFEFSNKNSINFCFIEFIKELFMVLRDAHSTICTQKEIIGAIKLPKKFETEYFNFFNFENTATHISEETLKYCIKIESFINTKQKIKAIFDPFAYKPSKKNQKTEDSKSQEQLTSCSTTSSHTETESILNDLDFLGKRTFEFSSLEHSKMLKYLNI